MSAALLTATSLSVMILIATTVLGLTAGGEADLWRHTSLGIFGTLINLLAHSLLMFYLLGKGRAVQEAMAEGELAGTWDAEMKRLRRPVFARGTQAMTLTMITAILGASVDTRVLPAWLHALVAYGAIAANVAALRAEIIALAAGARIVAEVDRRLRA